MIEVRAYQPEDAPRLREVFVTAIRVTARSHYTPNQTAAWAPAEHDSENWAHYMAGIAPFIAIVDGIIAGYADVNESSENRGYIEHFFVAPEFGNQGIGNALMTAIHQKAANLQLEELHSHVSLAAQRFFEKWGFIATEQQFIERHGQTLERHAMLKRL